MAERPTKTKPAYRLAAFSHWANLGLVATGLVAGATIDPMYAMALVPIEVGLLWALPDLPPFRAYVDARDRAQRLKKEREFYLERLFGLRPLPKKSFSDRWRGLFVADDTPDPDERVINRDSEYKRYAELREIVASLRSMVPIEGVRVTAADVDRIEAVVSGYLRILFACRPLRQAIEAAKRERLDVELQEVRERLTEAEPSMRNVLLERERMLAGQVARIPKLEASYELLRSRGDAMCYQLRNLHSQVLTDPGTQVNAALDEMIERNDMLGDPLQDLDADQMVRDLMQEQAREAPAPVRVSKAAAAARRQGTRH